MASKLRPTPPAFEAKPKKSAKKRDFLAEETPKKASKAAKTPPLTEVMEEVAQPVPAVKVTAGPFFDDRHPRPYEGWVVITRAGDIVTYHRFRSKEDAEAFARTATPAL